jgi:(p)ppGpp synthase/HD superfamily hydrolase
MKHRSASMIVIHALDRAAYYHRDQLRKGDGLPKLVHLAGVLYILQCHTDDVYTLVAGVLHDFLEDVPQDQYSGEQMIGEFGQIVYDTVKGASEVKDPNDSAKNKRVS